MNYENDLRIDDSALDIEWLEQPGLMFKYARHAADMRAEMDGEKEIVEYTRAELSKEIRENPGDFGIEKITESVVTGAITTDSKFIAANNKYINSKFEYEVAQGAVRAFDQRKTALENLVKLNGQAYFAGPSVPRDLSKEWEKKEKQKKVDAGIGTKLKRKQ